MVEVRQARYFLAVAEELHFGRAARRLRMSQPPLSQAIKRLEREIGCQLLHRTRRSVSLTPAGAELLGQCRALIRQSEGATIATRHAATGGAGRLTVGAVASAFGWPLPDAVEGFHAVMPGVDIRIREIDSHQAASALLGRTLDLAIVRQTAPVPGTAATALFTDHFVAALPTDHRAAGSAEPMDLAALACDRWIWLDRAVSPDYHDMMAASCRAAGFSPVPAHWARSVTSQIAMVGCRLGVTIVPATAAHPRDAVCFRPLRDPAAATGLTVLTREQPDRAAERFTGAALAAVHPARTGSGSSAGGSSDSRKP
jgi:DNA-binding transcriptional LysR family regulator